LQATSGELRQTVNIPAGSNPVTLEFWWLVESDAEHANDTMWVKLEVFGTGASIIVPLATYWATNPFGQWQYASFNLTAYAGSTVAVIFAVQKDDDAHQDDDASARRKPHGHQAARLPQPVP